MMDDFKILRALFEERALASIKEGRLILEEIEDQRYTLKITGIPDDVIAFKADMFPSLKEIVFRDRKHECRRADYVIIARSDENRRWIVYVEMKSGRGKRGEIKDQLRGAKCLVTYCREVGQQFWNYELGTKRFLERYAERFVSVRRIGTGERPTRSRPGVVHDNPDRMLRLSASAGALQFDKLLGAASRVD